MANVISNDEVQRVNPADGTQAHGPWNPGIQSQMPRELCHLSTIFRPENVFTSIAAATHLQGLTAFSTAALAALRPQRLALPQLLIPSTPDSPLPPRPHIVHL